MNAINKYKIRTDISKRIGPFTVYRIEALREFGSIKKGELGGWIEKEANLSQCGTCWVYDDCECVRYEINAIRVADSVLPEPILEVHVVNNNHEVCDEWIEIGDFDIETVFGIIGCAKF